MKLVYLAGPYRSNSIYGVVKNIQAAEIVAAELWRRGIAVICPHKNTALLDGCTEEEQDGDGMVTDDSVFFRGDLEMLKRCDAVILLPNWQKSRGTLQERTFGVLRGLPVFEWESQQKEIMEFAAEKELEFSQKGSS